MTARRGDRWRYLTADAVGAAAGLACDEALMQHYARDADPDAAAVLRLYTYREHCALVGRYQHLEEEVDLSRCEAAGIEVGRRPTGGGAIIMGPGQLGVAVTARAPVGESPRQTLRRYAEGVVSGLAELGIEAGFRSKNDLEVGGRKIAGLGVYFDSRGAVLFHSSVLVDLDVEAMLAVLRIPAAKLSDKAVRTVEERLTTVSRELGRRLEARDVRERMAAGIAGAFGVELTPGGLDADETARARELAVRYASREWIHQHGPRRDVRGRALLKTPRGLLRVHVDIHGGTLKNVLLTGDFNVLPAAVPRLESALKWCRAEPSAISEAVRRSLDERDLGMAPEEVATAVWRAVRRGLRLGRMAHPMRARGSCYYPETTAQALPIGGRARESERSAHDLADR